MSLRLACSALLLTALVYAAACDHAPVSPPSFELVAADSTSRIAFTTARDGNNEIYTMNADGSGVTRLTNDAAIDRNPAWWPDSARILFESRRDGNSELYAMNADGSGVTRLTTDPSKDVTPAGCGNRIAFASDRRLGPFTEIYVMNADGTGVTRLTLSNSYPDSPTWSPTCDRIAYSYDPYGVNQSIIVMNADGSNPRTLTSSSHNRHPAWSPDGTRIAFASDRDSPGNSYEIYVMNADGTQQTRVTSNGANHVYDFPTWSPNGTQIAFQSSATAGPGIYVMNADGVGGVTQIADSVVNTRIAWFGAAASPPPPPPPGNLTVRTSTSGTDLDPDGYTVTVDGDSPQTLALNDSSSYTNLTASTHIVTLSSVASNCTVNGSPRAVDVPSGGTATTTFVVTCAPPPPPPGKLTVFASTTGSNLDPDGYVVYIDSLTGGSVMDNDSTTFPNVAPGDYTVRITGVAANCTVTGSSSVTVNVPSGGTATTRFSVTCAAPPPPPPPPPPTGWPDEPTGFSVLIDAPFSALDENGWWSVQRETTNGSGLALAADSAAPRSPSGVLQFTFATGFEGGSAPGIEYYVPATPLRESYFAFWWKASNPWESHWSNVDAIANLFAATSGLLYLTFHGSTQSLHVAPQFDNDARDLTPNVNATTVTLGGWHLVEWYVKYSSTATSRDGVTRWWVDGVLQGDYRDLQMPDDAGLVEYDLAPTWGGVGETKSQTNSVWFDHARISTP